MKKSIVFMSAMVLASFAMAQGATVIRGEISPGVYTNVSVDGTGQVKTVGTSTSTTTGSKAAGTAAANSELVGAVYNSSLPNLTNGQQAALQMGATGSLNTSLWISGTSSPIGVTVTGADGVTNSSYNALHVGSYGMVIDNTNNAWYRQRGTSQGTSVIPSSGTLTNRSGTITTGGTAQTIMAANTSRRYLLIQNVSDTTMWCDFGTTAVQNQPSIQIIAGANFFMQNNAISTELVSCVGATTGKAFTAKEM